MSIESIINGLIFRRNGVTVAFKITESQFKSAICHTTMRHGVPYDGGFEGGRQSIAGAGAAIGLGAQTVDSSGLPIDAIQLGTGINLDAKTLQVYDWKVLDSSGKLIIDRLPTSVQEFIEEQTTVRKTHITSAVSTAVSRLFHTYLANIPEDSHVTFILPTPSLVEGLEFTFKIAIQQGGFAMVIERSGDTVIYVDGEEWDGVTSIVVGFWVTVVECEGAYYVTSNSGLTVDNKVIDE